MNSVIDEVKQEFRDTQKTVRTLSSFKKYLEAKMHNKNYPANSIKLLDEYVEEKKKFMEEKLEQAKTDETGMAKKMASEVEVTLKELNKVKFFLEQDTDKIDLPQIIPSAGMAKRGFVIEPLNRFEFIYNWCGFKGIARVEEFPETKQKYIKIEEEQVLLKSDPIREFCYAQPDPEVINKWINGKVNSLETKELYDTIKKYFKTFIDLQDDCLYDVLVLFVFQSWLSEILNSVFYLAIMAAWGAGKTITGELTTAVSKHGYYGSTSLAFIARMLDMQKITLFLDEIDSMVGVDDSEIFSILRQGYRRGAKYGRINKDNMNPQTFDIFGAKLFSIYSGSEAALLNRSIPITLTQSTDSQLPIINSKKAIYAKELLNKLYIWYLDNIIYYVDIVDVVDYTYKDDIYEGRKEIYEKAVSLLPKGSTEQLSQLTGRNAELGHIMAILSKIIGIDLVVNKSTEDKKEGIDLIKIFKFKDEVEEERMEIGNVAILRELLVEYFQKYNTVNHYITKEGFLKVSNKYLYYSFNAKLRSAKDLGCSPEKFQGYLRELGFERPHSRKKAKITDPGEKENGGHVRLCNIFTPGVLKKIGLPTNPLEVEEIKVNEEEG